jgi:hypothetical protein
MARFVLDIFLSSTSEDLRAFRAAVTGAVERLKQASIRMETWGAKPTAPLPTCRDEVQRCDAMIVVVGHRYGWIASEADGGDGVRSITWWEVAWALEAEKPVYAFLVDPTAPWTGPREQDALLSASTESEGLAVWRRVRSLQDFRAFLEQHTTRKLFATPDQLDALVVSSLFDLVLEHEVRQAMATVKEAPLSTSPPPALATAAAAKGALPEAFRFVEAKAQAVVVGSDVVIFAKGLPASQRSDIANALLLAQLARKSVPAPKTLDDVQTWFDEYIDVLSNIGFTFESSGYERITGGADGVDLYKVVVDVAKVTLDPVALALVGRTLESLRSLPPDGPTVSLFAVSATRNVAHFQVVLVEPDGTDGLTLRTLAFGLQTANAVSQILFFKTTKSVTALLKRSDRVTVNTAVLAAVRDAIAARLATRVGANVAGLDVD